LQLAHATDKCTPPLLRDSARYLNIGPGLRRELTAERAESVDWRH